MKKPKSNLLLRAAILDVVETQLQYNNPPETRQTYDHLLREGYSEEDAKLLIGSAVMTEIYYILKDRNPSII